MTPEDFRVITEVLPEAYLLVSGGGDILAANPAAATLFGLAARPGSGTDLREPHAPPQLAALVRDPPERVREFLRACSRSRSLLPGALSVPDVTGAPVRHRCEGAVLLPRSPDGTSRILLRVRREDTVVDRFALLTKRLGELTREVLLRRQVEAERAALLAQVVRAHADLEQQAVALDQQREEAESLAEELEQTNEELVTALEDAERARNAAEQANRAKGDFLAMMSHELRTPLNAIAGYTQLLALGVRGAVTTDQLTDLERIDRNQRHLLALINDVLNFAKLDAGRVSFHVTDVPVRDLLDGLDALFEPQLRAKQLRYSYALADGELAVRADPERARQVLANLLANAIKFTPAGGEIAVACAPDGGFVALRVHDTGIGIPADKLEAIFEPFVQLGRDLTSGGEGTGLGLAISRELARGMNGNLTVDSAPGGGSTFTLMLPNVDAARPPALPVSRARGRAADRAAE